MKKIIFLPGLACDRRFFAHQINFFKDQFEIATIVCNTSDNMNAHVDHVLAQATEKFILVGHSFGGWVAQWVAILAPERVSQLILLGTSTGTLTTELQTLFEKMHASFLNNQAMEFFDNIRPLSVHPTKANDTELHGIIKSMQLDFTKEGLLNQVKTDLEGKDTTTHLKDIQCNTLLVHGKQDPFYAKDMRLLADNIPDCHYVEVEHCGHMLALEQPQVVSELIATWFMKVGTIATVL